MPTLLRPEQQMNIYSGETWKELATSRYGSQLQGLGLDLEHAPQQTRGVDTLMKVGSADGLGYVGQDVWEFLNSPIVKRVAAVLMLAHGYQRNKSIFWAAIWAAFGYALPPAAVTVAGIQQFGKPKPACPAF